MAGPFGEVAEPDLAPPAPMVAYKGIRNSGAKSAEGSKFFSCCPRFQAQQDLGHFAPVAFKFRDNTKNLNFEQWWIIVKSNSKNDFPAAVNKHCFRESYS